MSQAETVTEIDFQNAIDGNSPNFKNIGRRHNGDYRSSPVILSLVSGKYYRMVTVAAPRGSCVAKISEVFPSLEVLFHMYPDSSMKRAIEELNRVK